MRRDDVISTIKHPAVLAARRSLGQVGGQPVTAFLLEDADMVSQALAAHAPVERVFALHPPEPREARVLEEARRAGVACHLVTRGVFTRILGLGYETSTRVLAAVSATPLPPAEALGLIGRDTCLLIGERIQDPRNVGVLIRTAEAFGLALAVLGKDSADPYARPSVRSTTGSICRVPMCVADDLIAFIRDVKQKSVRVIGTSAHAETPCWQADLSRPCAILAGNETDGLSPEAKAACDLLVTVPMSGGAHSFNVTVAAGIVIYEAARQDRQRRPRASA